MTLPHAIREGLWPPKKFPVQCVHMVAKTTLVTLMSTSQRLRYGPRECVICKGSRTHHFFTELACVKCVVKARKAKLVAQ